MEYYTYDKDGNYAGVTETEPSNNLWTAKPYVDSFVAPKWDGVKWIESAEWNKAAYAKEVNEMWDALIAQKLTEKDYYSMGDVALAIITNSPFKDEAIALSELYYRYYDLLLQHIETADENSDADTFIKSL